MELTIEFKDFVEILLSDDKYKDKKTYLFEDVKAIGNGIEKMNISDVFDINYMNGISIAGKYQDEKIFTVKNFLYNLKQGCCMGCMSIAIAGVHPTYRRAITLFRIVESGTPWNCSIRPVEGIEPYQIVLGSTILKEVIALR